VLGTPEALAGWLGWGISRAPLQAHSQLIRWEFDSAIPACTDIL
jgi:hypothetical protein